MLDRREFLAHNATGFGVAVAADPPLLAQLASVPAKLPDLATYILEQMLQRGAES